MSRIITTIISVRINALDVRDIETLDKSSSCYTEGCSSFIFHSKQNKQMETRSIAGAHCRHQAKYKMLP